MSIEKTKSMRQADIAQSVEGVDCRAVPLDELKRQLGLNLIEAARDQFSGNTQNLLARYRR